MEFLELKINNFLTIGDAPTLNLKDRGLVLIQGQNDDDTSATSNGVGKSSVVDALCWALFGTTARDESGDAVVNSTVKKDCSVSVLIADGAVQYRITRYRKHKLHKNQTVVVAEPGGIDMSKGTEKETQAVIDGIVGCSLDVFMAAIYAGQEVTPDLPKMTDKQLKLLIEEAAGVSRLEAAYEVARSKLTGVKTTAANIANTLTTVMARKSSVELDLAKKRLEAEAFDRERPTRAEVFKSNAEAHRTVLVRLVGEIKGVGEQALKDRLAALGSALADHSKKLAQRDTLKSAVTTAERAVQRVEDELDSLMQSAAQLKSDFENAETAVKKPCPSCGKSGTDHDVEDFRAHVKERLTEVAGKIRVQKLALTEARDKVPFAKAALMDFEATIPDVSDISREQSEINATLRTVEKKRGEAKVAKTEYDRQMELAAKVMTDPNPHTSAITTLEGQIAKLDAEQTALRAQQAEIDQEIAIFESVAKVFSPAGVRAHILDTVTPFLNERTADYLSALSDGNITAVWSTLGSTAKGELREKFNIEVSNSKGGQSFKLLSGGEKRKVRLATMLALQDLVASRATKPINIWIGDEIDDALDPAGLERLMGLLERKARERGTVLVISHNEMRDWCDQVATVIKKGGVSTIEGALV